MTPGTKTDLSAFVRTISGTSAGGSEVSFLDQGIQPISLNTFKFFETPRLIASTVNEDKLTALPKQKSFYLDLELASGDENLSPVIDLKNATFIFGRNKINNPVGLENYATDSRTNQITNDPHGSVFVSERVDLEQPATSLKVLVGASVQPEADFRVFYRLFSADSSEVSQTYRPFPGFKNMIDRGLLEEVRQLRSNFPLTNQMPSMRCVGYRQAWEYLEGKTNKDDFARKGIIATRQLAKRQMTWLKTENIKRFDCLSVNLLVDTCRWIKKNVERGKI